MGSKMIRLLKKILKRTPVYAFLLERREKRIKKRIIDDWYKMGRPIPPPPPIKQKIVKEYALRFSSRILIETGTYLGDMVDATKDVFSQIYSIELDENLYKRAKSRFSNASNIHIIWGDSSEVLPRILTSTRHSCLFWLDAHYSGGITAKGEFNTPIVKELKHIFAHPIKNNVILIDDARCFTGQEDYPAIEDLKKIVAKELPDGILEVRDDIIRIHRHLRD